MSLRRHIETIVKPWLTANAPWVFSNRRLVLGIVEEIDTDAQNEFAQTLNTALGGSWDPACHPWETRKDSMLDVFGKVQPFTIKPALQINRTEARLLVEALSGRWSYEQDRRETSAPFGTTSPMRSRCASIGSTLVRRHHCRSLKLFGLDLTRGELLERGNGKFGGSRGN